MTKIHALHEPDSLTMPLSDGACLRVTRFRESARVALTVYGPGGGDMGGIVLGTERARLLATWLQRMSAECGRAPDADPAPLVRKVEPGR